MFRILLKSYPFVVGPRRRADPFRKGEKMSGIEIGLRGEKEMVVSGGGWVIL